MRIMQLIIDKNSFKKIFILWIYKAQFPNSLLDIIFTDVVKLKEQ